ncbi:hypothetical protein [Inquilinus sp. Marseille-Q2685]|uniref:structural cement protein Gp24 n=1 Tax=Inquilinus sp. Marseille-Q2685 TaxID=2866581 RepID=UPI001CE42F30|nr:hypothetical protein [Inquilinus sp. Marseille-Q2685]
MAVVQTSYSETMRPATAGMIANLTNADADSRIVETAAGIGFGLAVGQGAAAKGAVLGAAAAAGFVGISIRDVVLDPADNDTYRQGAGIAVLTEGDIWVVTGGAVTAGDAVVFEAATGILSSLPADSTHFAIAGARWMTAAAGGGLAVLRLGGALPSA